MARKEARMRLLPRRAVLHAWHDRYSRYFPFSFDGFLLDDNNLDSALKPLNLIKLLSFSNAWAGI